MLHAKPQRTSFAKRIVAAASAAALVLALAAGGALAYLQENTNPVTNTFAFGGYGYELAFDAKGGTGAPVTQSARDTAATHAFTVPADIPAKANNTFLGWSWTENPTVADIDYPAGQADSATLNSTAPAKVLHAVWASHLIIGVDFNKEATKRTEEEIKKKDGQNIPDTTVTSVVFEKVADPDVAPVGADPASGTDVRVDSTSANRIKLYRVPTTDSASGSTTYAVHVPVSYTHLAGSVLFLPRQTRMPLSIRPFKVRVAVNFDTPA